MQAGLINVDCCAKYLWPPVLFWHTLVRNTNIIYAKKSLTLFAARKKKKTHPVFWGVSDVFLKHFGGKLCFLPWVGAGVCGGLRVGVVVVVGGLQWFSGGRLWEKHTSSILKRFRSISKLWWRGNLCTNEAWGSSLGKEQVQRRGGE